MLRVPLKLWLFVCGASGGSVLGVPAYRGGPAGPGGPGPDSPRRLRLVGDDHPELSARSGGFDRESVRY